MRSLVSAGLFVYLLSVAAISQAQLLPHPPFSPTNPQQCRAFATDVNQYADAYSKQHDDCLDRNKADRKNDQQGLKVCTRSSCQILHDIVYGDGLTSVKSIQKEVDDCYKQVNEHLAEEAQKSRQNNEARDRQQEQEAKTQPATQNANASVHAQQSPAVLPKEELPAFHGYTVDRIKVNETKTQEQARLAARERERQERKEQVLKEMNDPFAQSGGRSSGDKSNGASDGLVDPFGKPQREVASNDSGGNTQLADPFAPGNSGHSDARSDKDIAAEKTKDIAIDKAGELIKEKLKEAERTLDKDLEKASSTLSASDFKVYRTEIEEARSYLKGVSRLIEAAPFIKDAWVASSDFKKGWNDFAHDCESKGFEYVLKRLSPPLSKIYEGPVGWAGAILLDPSSTQTPEQDFDPMTAINDPSHYSFDQRVAALQRMYISQARHPEVWNDAQRQWLYNLTLQVYNSPNNPNIHLTPP